LRGPIHIKRDQLRVYMAYKEIFTSDAGKIVLEDLEAYCGMECYVEGNILATAKNAFQRDFLVRIKEMVRRAEGPIEFIDEEK